ncbi:MAG: T9SS type A sorting domain-containing protein [Salibacteraceae bacterium]
MKLKHALILASFFFLFSFESNASHLSVGGIRYDYVGLGSTPGTFKYKVSAHFVRYCYGISYSASSLQREAFWFRCASSGTTLGPFTATYVPHVPKPGERITVSGAKDISDVCSSTQTSCELSSGTNTYGYESFKVEYIIDLPKCGSWEVRLVSDDCCRNSAQNYSASPGRIGLETVINTSWAPKGDTTLPPANSAPKFIDQNIMVNGCTGQNGFYNAGSSDEDGDSLHFEFTCPWGGHQGSSTTNPFTSMTRLIPLGSHSCQTPFPTIKLDAKTGMITYNTNVSGDFRVAYYVSEYDPCTGEFKGKTYREIEMSIFPCSNQVPKDISGITNIQGNGIKTGKYTLQVCSGEAISWEDTIYDGDVLDTLLLSTNVSEVLKGATYSITSLLRNKTVIKFNWVASNIGGNKKYINLNYNDGRCDFPARGASIIEINVLAAASAGKDQIVCKGDTAKLEASGGTSYTWHVISGDPIINGVNWFPDSNSSSINKTALFLPTQTTKLWVEVDTLKGACGYNVSSSCSVTDTIVIAVVDSFSISTSPDIFLCNPGSGALSVATSQPSLTYSYQWAPSSFLDFDTVKSPTISGLNIPVEFMVTVTSNDGCMRESSVKANVTKPFPSNMKIRASDTIICLSKAIDLWVDKGTIDYGAGTSCDTSVYECQGKFVDYTKGTGSLTSDTTGTNYPATFATNAFSAKNQYLYLASDLRAMGIQAGPIDAISWEITGLNNGAPINDLTIKIGCSILSDLPLNGFVEDLKTTYTTSALFPGIGWNKFQFDTEYNWDGVSNLVVEVCWDNDTTRQLSHQIQSFDNTSYQSSVSYFQTSTFSQSACASKVSTGNSKTILPRTRFSGCSGLRSSLFKFDWNPKPTGGFIGSTNKDSVRANTNLVTASKYYVFVEDSAYGVCHDTLEIDINVVSKYDATPDPISAKCLSSGFIKLTAPTPYNISVPGGKWTGVGIINDTLGVWDPIASGIGKFPVTYSITGDACASSGTDTIEIAGTPNVAILAPDTLCELYGGTSFEIKHQLIPVVSGGWFSGFGVDSAIVGGKMTYWVDGTRFNPSSSSSDYVSVKYELFNGCLGDSTYQIPVIAQWDSTFQGTLDNGITYATNSFCMTSDYFDTLAVAGPNPIWSFPSNPAAIIDSSLGVFDAKAASVGQTDDFLGKITVSNSGFCGTTNRFDVILLKAPEVEVVSQTYCSDWVLDPANKIVFDTVRVRIPKGPALGGGSTKNLGVPGNDIEVDYAGISNTGWADAYDGRGDQFTYNYWDGNPWMTFPNIAKIRPASLQIPSVNFIEYQYAMLYRANHPYKNKCYSRDTGYVRIADELFPYMDTLYQLCQQTSVTLDAGYKGATYLWNDGSTGQTLNASKTGVYTVTVNTEFCSSTFSTEVTWCTNVESRLNNGMEVSLFPNPTSTILNLKASGVQGSELSVAITDLTGKTIHSGTISREEATNGIQIDVSELSSGVYMLSVSEGENYSTYRIVVE